MLVIIVEQQFTVLWGIVTFNSSITFGVKLKKLLSLASRNVNRDRIFTNTKSAIMVPCHQQ